MKCIERKIRLTGEEVVFECELLDLERNQGILKYVIDKRRSVGDLTLPAGTITLALYFSDRNYNIYYWIAPRNTGPAGGRKTRNSAGEAATDVSLLLESVEAGGTANPWARDIGYYFNIADPLLMSREEIAYRDLAVDILILPDGSAAVLDEEDLPPTLDPKLKRRIDTTRIEILTKRETILTEARTLLLPFAVQL